MIDFNARIKDALALASDTKVFQFGEDILKHAPDLFMENFPGKKALIVADGNTWVAAGEKVWSYFTIYFEYPNQTCHKLTKISMNGGTVVYCHMIQNLLKINVKLGRLSFYF